MRNGASEVLLARGFSLYFILHGFMLHASYLSLSTSGLRFLFPRNSRARVKRNHFAWYLRGISMVFPRVFRAIVKRALLNPCRRGNRKSHAISGISLSKGIPRNFPRETYPGYTSIYLICTYKTRTRTNTNPNDTEANAVGRSVRACVVKTVKIIVCRGQEA
jgi:hypothetical protein